LKNFIIDSANNWNGLERNNAALSSCLYIWRFWHWPWAMDRRKVFSSQWGSAVSFAVCLFFLM